MPTSLVPQEERIPGVCNVKKRLGLIDYDAIIAEEKQRLPLKLRDVDLNLNDAARSLLPPIGAAGKVAETLREPEARLEANRLKLPLIGQEKVCDESDWVLVIIIDSMLTSTSDPFDVLIYLVILDVTDPSSLRLSIHPQP